MRTSTDPPAEQSPPRPAELEHHPAAALFPLLPVDGPEFGELVADIGPRGLLQPIVLHGGKILEGRNRYRACQHAGVAPRFAEWRGDSPTAYARHVTEDQRAAIAVEAKERSRRRRRSGSASTAAPLQGVPQHCVRIRTQCPAATMPPHTSAAPTAAPRRR
jgi:hypothetical protein